MSTVQLPEINFISTDVNEIVNDSIKTYERLSGRKLAEADPIRIILLSHASIIVQQNVKINEAARQNLLYYAQGDILDHKGAEWDTPRIEATPATTTIKFTLSQVFDSARIIPRETLVTADGTIFFQTTEDLVIAASALHGEVRAECTEVGTIGNDYQAGTITTLVKPLPYVARVENITISEMGSGRESDEHYRARIWQAPEKISVAGSTEAYEYHVKSVSSSITDVHVHSSEPGYVHIAVLADGGLPGQELLDDVTAVVSDRKVRPLTDFVVVMAPKTVEFEVRLTYWIETEAVDKTLLQQAIATAIRDYVAWQTSKIGRDINPSRLISDVIRAGAKRVDVISPAFTVVQADEVATCIGETVNFGGIEDD